MAMAVLVSFLLLPAGAISAIYLVVKAIGRSKQPPTTTHGEGEKVAWALLVLGLAALAFIYFVGSAMAYQ